jgi:integrase
MYQPMSVFKIKDHGTSETLWVVQVYNRGKRVRLYSDPKTKKRFKTRAQALEKEAELRGRFEMESKPQQPKILCKDLADLFFASLQKKLKPSSIYTRSSFYKNYVEPNFGGYYVQDLTNDDLDRFNEKLNKAPRGSMCNVVSTVRTYVKFLRKWNPSLLPERIFEYLSSTPDDHIYHFYTLEQERKFLSVITNPRDKLLFTIFCYYGMRMTECIALKRGDISLEEGTISVRRIVLTKSLYKKQVFTTPKTKRSVRTLTLIKDVADLIKPDQDPRTISSRGNTGPSSSTKGTSEGWRRNTPRKPGFPPSRSTSSVIAAPQTSFGRTSPFALWLSGSGTPKARSWTTTPICSRTRPTRSAASSTAIRSSIAEGGKACHRSPSPSRLLPWVRLARSRAENRSRKNASANNGCVLKFGKNGLRIGVRNRYVYIKNSDIVGVIFSQWSGWRDSNPRSSAPKADALNQAALHPESLTILPSLLSKSK